MAEPSRILGLVEQGRPLQDVLVIDCHVHYGVPERVGNPWWTAEGLLLQMDRLGIDQACISPGRALRGDVEAGNDDVLALVRSHPQRFIGFAVYNPHQPEQSAAELERCRQQPGMRGIKVHPATYVHDYPLDGPKYEPVWAFVERTGWPVLTHAGPRSEAHRCGPELIERVAARHRQARLIIGHAGAYDSWDALEAHLDLVRRHDNLSLDISAMGRFYRAVDYMVQQVGSERVLFGSDAPGHSFTAEVGHVVYARLSDADKERVLGLNMARLLGLRR